MAEGVPDDEIVALRLEREGCGTGELHFTLIWNDIADLDLHVIAPSGEHLYFGHRESRCGGWLDKDMNVDESNASEKPVENMFWSSSPSGKYKVYVNNYNCHTRPGTKYSSFGRSVPYKVRMVRNGEVSWFSGSVKHMQDQTCFEFEHRGSGALGSFLILPGYAEKSTFKDICAHNNVPYECGTGYYMLNKREKISQKKDVILHDAETDTFVIGRQECLETLGMDTSADFVFVKPKDVPAHMHLFVQSTSYNRKIPANTKVLVKVPVKVALQHRRADQYRF